MAPRVVDENAIDFAIVPPGHLVYREPLTPEEAGLLIRELEEFDQVRQEGEIESRQYLIRAGRRRL